MVVDKLNVNYSGHQINAEPISVPENSPYKARTVHNRILKEEPSTIEIWQHSDKSGSWLTEEPYTGTVSSTGKFQVDYDGAEDGDMKFRNTILFHAAQANTEWFIWYKSIGDIYDADDFNAKVNKTTGTENNFAALDNAGGIKDSGKKADDFEPKIDPKGTAFNKNFGNATGTVCEGNDSRLSDARPPTAHKYSHITGGDDIIPNAVSGGNSGLMTGADKQNLDDAVSKKHTQNTDQYLDFGGANQVTVADAKDAVAKKHTQGTDTTLGNMTADINMNSHKITGLAAPTNAGDAIRQTTKITEEALETVIDSGGGGGGGGLSLVQNGSFEVVNTNGVPWCWETTDPSPTMLAQDTGVIDGYGGNKAIKITGIGSGIIYTFRHLKPSTTYSVRVWAKAESDCTARAYTTGGSSNMDETSTSTTGEYITGTFTTNATPSNIVLYLVGTGNFWFDALTVIEGSTPPDRYLPAPTPAILEFQDFYSVSANFPGLETLVGTNVLKKYVYALDDTTEEPLGFNYSIPTNFDPSGYLMIEVVGFPKTVAASKNVEFTYYYSCGNHDESWDVAYSNLISGDLPCINTAKDRHIFRFQKDIYTISPALFDVVESKISRTAPSANNLAGDFYFEKLRIWIPRV